MKSRTARTILFFCLSVPVLISVMVAFIGVPQRLTLATALVKVAAMLAGALVARWWYRLYLRLWKGGYIDRID